ncbi:MAG TPA: amino acid ABC transporter permease [Candidatus Sulfotelmatobacter sp.]|nr:amino acid ABC transporter permease [Candidatus Sulfotelmatobacter sp.]
MTASVPLPSAGAEDRPPTRGAGPLAWLRANLFNSWFNGILTVLAIYVIARVGWYLLRWGFIDAVWTGTSAQCHAASGACWALISVKYRQILFGTYPYDQQWRGGALIFLFVAMLGVSCVRAWWNRWLLLAWAVALVVMAWLMLGGLGLPFVSTSYWNGLPITIIFAAYSLVFAFPLAILLALGRRSHLPIVRSFSVAYIELIRGVPLISILFMAAAMFPLFMPAGSDIDPLIRVLVGTIFFAAAYMAEVIRAGLAALPRGQYEAGEALGLTYMQRTGFIIMPQALKTVIPPMVNTFISTFKNTTLLIIIGLYDFLGTGKLATTEPAWRAFSAEAYVFVALVFFAFCFFMSKFSQYLESVLRRGTTR